VARVHIRQRVAGVEEFVATALALSAPAVIGHRAMGNFVEGERVKGKGEAVRCGGGGVCSTCRERCRK
uniref:hypothetical protein n=1 Tax=Hassallia byssoidea TaxID=482630 RepID=UPI001F20B419